MKILRKILVTGISATIILVIALAIKASAYADITDQNIPPKPETDAAVAQAIQNNDYNSWFALITANGNKPRILEYVNQGNFSKYSEMYGYIQKAENIRAELGLPKGPMGDGGFMEKGETRDGFKKNEAVMSALESGDYNAFVTALSNDDRASKMFSFVTKDNFSKFAEMHKLMKEGKRDEAKAIADELGFVKPQMGTMKHGSGQWKGRLNEDMRTETQN